MRDISTVSFFLIFANIIISYNGFTNTRFFDDYKFEIDKILKRKEYIRLISSGFLHTGWTHLIINIISIYVFSATLNAQFGWFGFLLIYLVSLIGGNLLTLYIHRNHWDYSGVGASGAVCGIMFAAIAVFPGMNIGLLFLPISLPAWIFGLAYVLYTIYGIKSDNDNIGHAAHLGGALLGMITALLLLPSAIVTNYITILLIMVPVLIFMYIIIYRPAFLLINNYSKAPTKKYYSIEHKYHEERVAKQKEIDGILEKINKRGVNSLTKSEKERLDEYARRSR